MIHLTSNGNFRNLLVNAFNNTQCPSSEKEITKWHSGFILECFSSLCNMYSSSIARYQTMGKPNKYFVQCSGFISTWDIIHCFRFS